MAFLRMDGRSRTEMRKIETARDPRIHARFLISERDRVALGEALAVLSEREGSELRTDFPSGWTVFWKLREGESRFLVAHPEADQWVATLAFSKSHWERVLAHFANWGAGEGEEVGRGDFNLGSLEVVSRVSNFEAVLAVDPELPEGDPA